MKGLLVIPAYNEEANIARTILRVRDAEAREEILVVNDGSKDGTSRVLDELGVFHITHAKNKGYLGALRTGMNHARANNYDYVVFFDADGQHDAGDLVRFREKLSAPTAPDIVTGSRFVPSADRRHPDYKAPLGRKRVAGDSMYDLAASLKYPFRTMKAIAKLYPAARRHRRSDRSHA